MLRDDPARLADEAAAISMMGGRRLVKVTGAGDRLDAGIVEGGQAVDTACAGVDLPYSRVEQGSDGSPANAAIGAGDESGSVVEFHGRFLGSGRVGRRTVDAQKNSVNA